MSLPLGIRLSKKVQFGVSKTLLLRLQWVRSMLWGFVSLYHRAKTNSFWPWPQGVRHLWKFTYF